MSGRSLSRKLLAILLFTAIFLSLSPVAVFSAGTWVKCDQSHECMTYGSYTCCPDEWKWKASCSDCSSTHTTPQCGWPEKNVANYTRVEAWCVDSTPGNDAYNKKDWSVENDWKPGDESFPLFVSDTTCEGPHWMNATTEECVQIEDDDSDDNNPPNSPGGHWNTHIPYYNACSKRGGFHYSNNPKNCPDSCTDCGSNLSTYGGSHDPTWASDKNNFWRSSWTVSDPKLPGGSITLTHYMLYFVDWDYEIDVEGNTHTPPTEDDYLFCTGDGTPGSNPSQIVDTTNPDMEDTRYEGSYIAWVQSGEQGTQPGDYDQFGWWGCCGDDPDEWFTGRVCNNDNVWCRDPDHPGNCVHYTTSA